MIASTRLVAALLIALAVLAAPGRAEVVTARNAPAVSDYLLQKGITALEGSRTDDAIELLEQAIVAYPKNSRAFAFLGRAHGTAGRDDRAKSYYDTALMIDADNLKALQWSGEIAVAEGETEAAQDKLERLRRLCGGRCAEFRALEKSIEGAAP